LSQLSASEESLQSQLSETQTKLNDHRNKMIVILKKHKALEAARLAALEMLNTSGSSSSDLFTSLISTLSLDNAASSKSVEPTKTIATPSKPAAMSLKSPTPVSRPATKAPSTPAPLSHDDPLAQMTESSTHFIFDIC
jgi:hypothetical protein